MTDSRRALVLGLGVAGAYLVLATVSGRLSPFAGRPILDGFAPPPPYRWVSPPPDLAPTNKPPPAGRFSLRLDPATGSRADVFSTSDGQVSLAMCEGAVPSRPGQDSVTLIITPMAPAEGVEVPRKLQIAGNVYRIDAEYQPDGTPVRQLRSPARLVIAYPLPLDVAVYHHTTLHSKDGSSWSTTRSTDSLVGQLVHSDVTDLGFFAVGQAVLERRIPLPRRAAARCSWSCWWPDPPCSRSSSSWRSDGELVDAPLDPGARPLDAGLRRRAAASIRGNEPAARQWDRVCRR